MIVLRNASLQGGGEPVDLAIEGDRVHALASPGELAGAEREVDLGGRLLMPALVNGHDHLDFSTFPPLGRPPYASVYDWMAEVDSGHGDPRLRAALAVPLTDRLFLGGLRNLLAGVAAVAHHGAYHRSLGARDFPLRVLSRYQFAHSPGLTADLRRTYRSSDRRIPWMLHAAEGTDERCRAEVGLLAEKNLVRQNTVLLGAIALGTAEATLLAERRACLVWCPESNRHLYGATAPVGLLRAAGVRLGLGSDSPLSGVRDALSNLAAAHRESALPEHELLSLATSDTAEVVRLPAGAPVQGGAADLIAVRSLPALLAGERRAVSLLLVAGRAVYGDPELMAPLGVRDRGCAVDGEERRIAAASGRRAAALLRAHSVLQEVPWARGLVFD